MTTELHLTPVESKVAVGVATKLGIVGTIILAACSVLTTVLAGYHGHDTRLLATLATIVAVATIIGRMAQAIAKELSGKLTPLAIGRMADTVKEGLAEAGDAVAATKAEGGVRKPTRSRQTS